MKYYYTTFAICTNAMNTITILYIDSFINLYFSLYIYFLLKKDNITYVVFTCQIFDTF